MMDHSLTRRFVNNAAHGAKVVDESDSILLEAGLESNVGHNTRGCHRICSSTLPCQITRFCIFFILLALPLGFLSTLVFPVTHVVSTIMVFITANLTSLVIWFICKDDSPAVVYFAVVVGFGLISTITMLNHLILTDYNISSLKFPDLHNPLSKCTNLHGGIVYGIGGVNKVFEDGVNKAIEKDDSCFALHYVASTLSSASYINGQLSSGEWDMYIKDRCASIGRSVSVDATLCKGLGFVSPREYHPPPANQHINPVVLKPREKIAMCKSIGFVPSNSTTCPPVVLKSTPCPSFPVAPKNNVKIVCSLSDVKGVDVKHNYFVRNGNDLKGMEISVLKSSLCSVGPISDSSSTPKTDNINDTPDDQKEKAYVFKSTIVDIILFLTAAIVVILVVCILLIH